MSNHWFRFYNAALNNPKVQKLSGDLFKAWINILCVTSQCDAIPNVTELCFYLRVTEDECHKIISELLTAGLIHEKNKGYIPHDWDEMQYKSDTSTERMKRHRDKKRDGNGDVTVTAQIRSDLDQNRSDQSDSVTNEKGSFKFNPTDDTHLQALSLAPGWDRQALYEKFSEWISTSAKELPTDPQKAFLGWVPKFIDGKNRKHYAAKPPLEAAHG